MRAFINDDEYQGTPQEIATFLNLREGSPYDVTENDIQTFDNIVSDSQALRRKLEENPDYNPYGGVVPSKEAEPDVDSKKAVPFEIPDTGVKPE